MENTKITNNEWKKFKKLFKVGQPYCNFLAFYPLLNLYPKYCYVKVVDNINAIVEIDDLRNNYVTYDINNIKNTFIWYEITTIDDDNKKVYAKCIRNTNYDNSKILKFIDEHKVGDIVKNVAIQMINTEDSKREIILYFAPGISTKIVTDDKLKFYKNPNGTVNVKITGLKKEIAKIYVRLLDNYSKEIFIQRLINKEFGEPFLTEKYKTLFSNIVDLSQVTDDPEHFDVEEYSIKLYEDAIKNDEIMSDIKQTKATIVLHPFINKEINRNDFIFDKNHSPICIGVNINQEKKEIFFKFVGSSSMFAQQAIEIYTKIKVKYAAYTLKDMVLSGENWDYPLREDNYILSQYLRFSYYKSLIDNNIVYSKNSLNMIFNTGLVNEYYEDIYCLFHRNSADDKWSYDCFCTEKDSNGQRIIKTFERLPQKNKFIKSPDEIFFDSKIPLTENFEHIFEQNLKRFNLRYLRFTFDQKHDELTKLFLEYNKSTIPKEQTEIYNKILSVISNSTILKNKIYTDFTAAVKLAIKRCEWNYKTAVPIYYAIENKVTLLLPLAFQVNYDENKKDLLALVVAKEKNEKGEYVYAGKTVLTLEQSYLDARSICRPNSDWLVAEKSLDSEENNEEDEDDDF